MNSLQHTWDFLKGKKTYIISLAAVIYSWGITQGVWQHSYLIDTILASGAVASVRHAMDNTTPPTPPKP